MNDEHESIKGRILRDISMQGETIVDDPSVGLILRIGREIKNNNRFTKQQGRNDEWRKPGKRKIRIS